MRYVEKKEGGIFFVPLFLPAGVKENTKDYSGYEFDPGRRYAFGRLIEIDQSGGDLVEIFSYVGHLPANADTITRSGLMFKPIHVSMGFSKNRWRFVFADPIYDRERDSNYLALAFLLGDASSPRLWRGGQQAPIDVYDANLYDEWIVYPATKVEEMMRAKLA